MLLKLTNRCNELCSHCMESSTPDGNHMTWEILEDSVKFINESGARVLVVSGGEFTTDPEFYDKIKYLIDKCTKVISMSLQSNGSWIEDNSIRKSMFKLLNQKRIVGCQISTCKKYYPNYEWTVSHKDDFKSFHRKIQFMYDWQGVDTNISHLGRAKSFPISECKGNPNCSPIVCRSNQIKNILRRDDIKLSDLINYLELSGYLCKPLINEDGHIHIGESPECSKVGHVSTSSSKEVLDALINSRMCNKCGQLENMRGKVPDYVIVTGRF